LAVDAKKVLIMGLPGAGKTTLAQALVPRLNGVHFNADAVRANVNKDLGFTLEDRLEQARPQRVVNARHKARDRPPPEARVGGVVDDLAHRGHRGARREVHVEDRRLDEAGLGRALAGDREQVGREIDPEDLEPGVD